MDGHQPSTRRGKGKGRPKVVCRSRWVGRWWWGEKPIQGTGDGVGVGGGVVSFLAI